MVRQTIHLLTFTGVHIRGNNTDKGKQTQKIANKNPCIEKKKLFFSMMIINIIINVPMTFKPTTLLLLAIRHFRGILSPLFRKL